MEKPLRQATWISLGMGLVFPVLGVVKIASQWTEAMGPTRIDSCELRSTGKSHAAWITTFEGEEIRTYVGRCPHGEAIEKRRGEFNYRVDGKPLGDWDDVLFAPLMMLGMGIVALPLGIYLRTQWSKDA